MSHPKLRPFIALLLLVTLWSCEQSKPAPHISNDYKSPAKPPLSKEDSLKGQQIEAYFRRLYAKGVFNGNVLVATHGRVIFQGCFGWADYKQKKELTPETSFQLASVSKQFTSVAIMILKERGLISYDDPVQKYIPNFPYHGITIRMLIGHRSGLPNYIYFSDRYVKDKETPITNSFVLALMTSLKPPVYYIPDRRFNYSNTGYMVLAAVVEKVSGMPFADFIRMEEFNALGMNHSFVASPGINTDQLVATGYKGGWRIAPKTFLDGVVGDKGVYSSVEDLFLWDQGLYSGKILKPATLLEAFKPYGKALNSPKNYGFGWRMYHLSDSTKVLYHSGWWEGFQTLLVRVMKDSTTVVVLKNRKSSHVSKDDVLRILYPESCPADKKSRQSEENSTDDDEQDGGH
ncbi:MAG: serine hydrolase [Bacteroidetes bacterium]|nr:serine hydrolase [Bacteroidota bacterium]